MAISDDLSECENLCGSVALGSRINNVSLRICVCVLKWEERPASSRSLTTATKTSPLSDISTGIGGRTERTTNFPIPFLLDAWAFEWSIRQDIGPVRGQTWISIDKNSCIQCFFCLLLLLSAADDLFRRSIQKWEKVHQLFNLSMKCQMSSCKKKMLALQYCRYIKWGLSLSGDDGGGGGEGGRHHREEKIANCKKKKKRLWERRTCFCLISEQS